MELGSKKRTIDSFFTSSSKRAKPSSSDTAHREASEVNENAGPSQLSTYSTYPFPVPHLPLSISSSLSSIPSSISKPITQADLDLLYFQPYIPKYLERELFEFLRGNLFFYRVEYKIKRGGIETLVRTPRYTTVFGLDDTSCFNESGHVIDTLTRLSVHTDKHYAKIPPRPIPKCLDDLRRSTEAVTESQFNFCLVNYYASGTDSISYHSDDERFLGSEPTIASFSLGARREFLMKHKPPSAEDSKSSSPQTIPIKLPLASGDMILMRGRTQANWLHSIPKRTGKNAEDGGRINITFRRALVKAGTENYYNYNVGNGPIYRWDPKSSEMKLWNQKK